MILIAACGGGYFSWYAVGPVQVVGDSSEIWLFLEFDRQVSKSGYVYDAPNTYPVGHFQEVWIFERGGEVRRFDVGKDADVAGVTFHPNNTRIFVHNNELYLYAFGSMDYKGSLFKWSYKSNQFELLPYQEIYFDSINNNDSYGVIIEALDSLTLGSGWDLIYTHTSIVGSAFKWNESDVEIKVIEDGEYFVLDMVGPFETVSAKYRKDSRQINQREFIQLPQEAKGHHR